MMQGFEAAADRLAGAMLLRPRVRSLAQLYLARAPGGDVPETHIYYYESRIAFAQVYPFLFYRDAIRERFGVSFRFLPITPYLEGRKPESGAAHVMIQPWFTVDREKLTRLLEQIRAANSSAQVDFVDAFAPNDLRLARTVEPFVRYYLKKSLFKERETHRTVFLGDTNLEDYVARTFGQDIAPVDHGVPAAILPRLRLSPNFFTAPQYLHQFLTSESPPDTKREFGIHARMDLTTDVRRYPREQAFERVRDVPGHHIVVDSSDDPLPWAAYLKEMQASAVCLSPFGYGELCWRDIEAILTGAVLVKPDMSHLDTLPDLYAAGETYLPVRWDFSDLAEVVAPVMADDTQRRGIALTAWTRLHTYLREDRFLDDMAFLWADT